MLDFLHTVDTAISFFADGMSVKAIVSRARTAVGLMSNKLCAVDHDSAEHCTNGRRAAADRLRILLNPLEMTVSGT